MKVQIWVVIACAFVASTAAADRRNTEDVLKKFEQFTDAMCKCKAGDTKCAQRVIDDQMKWAEEMAKNADRNEKPDPELARKIEPIMSRYTKCATSAMTPKESSSTPSGPAMTMPEVAKLLGGTWRCTGKRQGENLTATIAIKSARELEDAWIQSTTTATSGKSTTKGVQYTRIDIADKRWYRSGVDGAGNAEWSTSDGPEAGKIVWDGELRNGATTIKVRQTEDISDKKQLKMSGEISLDGKSWKLAYEATCKR